MRKQSIFVAAGVTLGSALLVLLGACASADTANQVSPGASNAPANASIQSKVSRAGVPTVVPAELPEIRPGSGYLIGYLQRKDLPDSLKLVSAPPVPGSAAAAADEAAYRAGRALRGSPRWTLAADDTNLKFPKAAEIFSCALDLPISQETTPHLNMLLRRTLADAGLSTNAAKDHYKRVRPFIAIKEATCAPAEEPSIAKDPSYPSGHAAVGWAWSLVLTELAPERADLLLARGHAFGQSRMICGAHWQSDVDSGRQVGAAAVARLQSDSEFRAQLLAARTEISQARAKGLRAARNCQSETAALKLGR